MTTVYPRRYEFVDFTRGLASLAVLITHYRWFFAIEPGNSAASDRYNLPGESFLWPLYEYGHLAVQFFWVLSGLVFAVAYGFSDKSFDARQFGAYRVARLYPLHLVTLLIVAVLQLLSLYLHGDWQVYSQNDFPHFLAQLGMASNWFTQDSSFNFPVWSVSVEVLIYFVFAVAMRILGFAAWWVGTLFAVFFIIERLTYHVIPMCGALFFLGMLVALASGKLYEWLGRASVLVSFVALVLGIFGWFALRRLGVYGHEEVIFSYVIAPLVLFVVAQLDRAIVSFPRRLRWIGGITYSVYLCHIPLIIGLKVAAPAIFSDPALLTQPWALCAYVAIVVMIALVVHEYFELPAQEYLRLKLTNRPIGPKLLEGEQYPV